MHLGYHELRNMLSKFREEREKRKMAPPSSVPAPSGGTGVPPTGTPSRAGGDRGDYRSSRGGEEYRDRERGDRGYDRHSSSRYESVYHALHLLQVMLTCRLTTVTDEETTENVRGVQGGGGTDLVFSCLFIPLLELFVRAPSLKPAAVPICAY